MKRFALVLLALLLGLATVGLLAGCGGGDQTEEANAAIDASNKAVDAANEADAEAVALFEKIGKLEPGSASTDEALKLVEEAEAAIAAKNAQVQKAADELAKIKDLEVSQDFKTYADQQIEIAKLQIQSNELLLKATAEFKKVFENAGDKSPDMKQLQQSFQTIDEVFAQADELSASIEEKAATSDAFFQEKSLGE